MNTQDAEVNPNIFALFKGPSSAGKSVAALSFPNPAVLDFDAKMPAIALKHFPNKSIEYYQFENTNSLFNLINSWLECPICGMSKTCIKCSTRCPHETLIYDSLTNVVNLSDNTLANIKGDDIVKLTQRLMKTKSGSSKIDLTDWDYYKVGFRCFDYLIDTAKILFKRDGNPKHIIFTAHVVDIDEPNLDGGGSRRVRRIVSHGKSIGAWVPTKFDESYMFSCETAVGSNNSLYTRHICNTQTIGQDDAKTAFLLPREIDFTDRNLDGSISFFDLLMNSIKSKKEGQKFLLSTQGK